MTSETTYTLTAGELTQLAYRAAGAALAYAGCEAEDLPVCMQEIEPTIDSFVIELCMPKERSQAWAATN